MQPIPNQSNTSAIELNSIKSDDSRQLGKCNKKLWIIISIIAAVVIAAVIVAIVIVMKKKDDKPRKVDPIIPQLTSIPSTPEPVPTPEPINKPNPTNKPDSTNRPEPEPTNRPTPTPEPINPSQPDTISPIDPRGPLENEFSLTSTPNEQKRITVNQISNDESKFNGQSITTNVNRTTVYDIFFLSAVNAPPEDKNFYSKMYTGAIAIASECVSTGDESCEMKEMVDLSKSKQDTSKLRLLDENVNLKNVPLALCLFNITDNDFITSITCHDQFPDLKKNEMLLDLYFFRSPAIERKNKTRDNITITIQKDTAKNRQFIREQNGGLCNIHNNWGSLCTTDMNITTDLKGNLISYDELAITNIAYDRRNSFTKTKKSNLKDHSENITQDDMKNYRTSLEKLLEKMKPYMKEDVQFPREKFVELYNLIKNPSEGENSEEKPTTRRRLDSSAAVQYIRQKELLHIDSLGVQADLNLKINPGLNSNAMSSNLIFSFDEFSFEMYKKEQLTDIQTIINQLSSLSKAGNILATQLYDKIIDKLENLPNEISIKLRSLYDLLQYYELLPIFNATLSTISYNKISPVIIKVSNELISKMSGIYYDIDKKGDVKQNVEKLADDLYEYVNHTNDLVDIIHKNIKELHKTFLNKSNPFTQITNYYLNNTFASYYHLIHRILYIYRTYFEKELNHSYPKIQNLIQMFEEESENALKEEREYLLDLYTKLSNGSLTIVDIPEGDFQKVLSNLNNTYVFSYDIIQKIKEYIIKKIDIKDSGYYLTKYEIEERNKTYMTILKEIDEVLKVLFNDTLIDKAFDEIMIQFKQNEVDILKYMDDKKYEYFPLEENVLSGSLFTNDVKKNLESKVKDYTANILSKIEREIDYKKQAKENISEFLDKHVDELNELMTEIEILVSEEDLERIVNAFEISLNQSLNKLSQDIDNNVVLTEEYFNHFYNTMYNRTYLLDVLRNYHYEEIPKIKYFDGDPKAFMGFLEEIYRMERTTAYITKYNNIISTWNYTEKFLKNQLASEVLADYKKIFTALKEELQSTVNVETLQKLLDLEDLVYYKSHVKTIQTLQNRIDKYFSEEIFETKYSKYVENLKTKYNTLVIKEKDYIKKKHNYILKLPTITNRTHDFCIVYQRKICYGCTNCVWNTFDQGRFCLVLTPYQNNYLMLEKSVYEIMENNENFSYILNTFMQKINERVIKYNSIIKILETNLIRIKNETLDKDFDYSNDYIYEYAEWIKDILNGKFGDEIIRKSYNYYYAHVQEKFKELLENISKKWKDAYLNLFIELNTRFSEIKYTMYEFGLMGQIYQSIIEKDFLNNYFDSIIIFQKSEFNYTITQYYDYFYRIVNDSYSFILANLPKEDTENEYNYFLLKRKNETLKYFELIFANLSISQEKAINFEYQKSLLKVKEEDFFKVYSKINKTKDEIYNYINDKIDQIIDLELFENDLDITQNSLTARFYLENREFAKLIEEMYSSVDEGKFFHLNFDKFKNMMSQNWIFDSNDFANIINDALYETNKDIQNDININLDEFATRIEKDIKEHFKRDIEKEIRELYEINIRDLTTEQKTNIKNIINENLNQIKLKIQNEINNITSYNHYYTMVKIEDTMKYYKNYLLLKFNDSMSFVLNEFEQNINKNLYENCVEPGLNKYLEIAKKVTDSEEFGEIKMMNTTYKVGEVIYNLVVDVVNKIKLKAKKKIYFKYLDYYDKIMSDIDFTKLQGIISDKLDDVYEAEVLSRLNEHNKKLYLKTNVSYDFSDTLKKEINTTIKKSIEDIELIVTTTKGVNFEAKFDCSLDFSDSGLNVIDPLCRELKDLLNTESDEQIEKINEIIQETIKSNLNDFLENVIPSFGNEFFDRIIDYNINFKIYNLYDNLQYALGQHFLYYAALGRYTDEVRFLPVDLKERLYRLNDLNFTIIEKKEEIIDLLEQKLNELINNLKNFANETYTSYLINNEYIQSHFNPIVVKAISRNLISIMSEIQKEYEESLEKYLKERFLKSFTTILSEETNKMLDAFYKEKERLVAELDKLFSEVIDKDLNEVNRNINKTVDSIRNYYSYLKTFSISDKIENFFRFYANTTLVTLIETFRYDLDNLTFAAIIEDINTKSKIIENIKVTDFLNQIRGLKKYFELNYYNPIKIAYNEYNTPSYRENLLDKMRGILDGLTLRNLVEGEEEEIERKRQESKDVEETFDEIKQLVEIALKYSKACFECDYLTNTAAYYNSKANMEYKKIKNWITSNKYRKNIHNFLTNKLYKLYYNILSIYYSYVKSGVSEFRIHMKTNINVIYLVNNNTMYTTADTLNDEYKKILDSAKEFEVSYANNKGRNELYEYVHKTEHMINKASATFTGIKEYSEFKYDTDLIGGLFKTPYVKARIVDKSRPDKLLLNVRNEYGFCARTSFRYNVNFTDANYTLTLDYNTKSNNINITTYTNFDKYYYSSQMYQIPEKFEMESITYFGYTVYFIKQCYSKALRNLSDIYINEVPAKNYSETMIIVG